MLGLCVLPSSAIGLHFLYHVVACTAVGLQGTSPVCVIVQAGVHQVLVLAAMQLHVLSADMRVLHQDVPDWELCSQVWRGQQLMKQGCELQISCRTAKLGRVTKCHSAASTAAGVFFFMASTAVPHAVLQAVR